jgi:CsoR family transcriptional regulator, copper-sensing transcriptional repressor
MRRKYTPMGYSGIDMAAAEPTPPPQGRGYSASKEQLLARLRRIEGQVRGIERMVEDDRYCIDVLTQISAAQAALEKVALGLLDGHARSCVLPADGQLQADRTDELMAAVGRLVKRG